jgi:hypothetical protein
MGALHVTTMVRDTLVSLTALGAARAQVLVNQLDKSPSIEKNPSLTLELAGCGKSEFDKRIHRW